MTVPLIAQANVGYRTAVIDEIESTARVVASDVPLVHVKQSGTWVGSNCPPEWAYFNAADNPHLMATLLAASIAGKVVRIYVNGLLPRVNNFCQITYVTLMPAS